MSRRRNGTRLASVFVTSLALGLSGCVSENAFMRTPSMLSPQGPIAARIAGLSWLMIILGTIVFLGVMLYLAYAIWGGRGHALEDELRTPNEGTGIVLSWGVGFSVIVLVLLFGLNIGTMRANNQVALQGQGLIIDVIGRQWWWEVQYPEQGFETANEIHIPAGQAVTLRLSSRDVIHSLWIPELAGKLDLLPNQVNELTLFADHPGEYWGECAEFCGTQHANMRLVVVAHSEADFARWVEYLETSPAPPMSELAREGHEVFFRKGCAKCHTIRGTEAAGDLGPDLTHLESHRTIGAGTLEYSLGNEAFWIMNSQALKPGNKMPSIDLSNEELAALMSYLETLK